MSNRQDGPHAHCSVFHPTYKWLFVPDLGDNCIHQYGYDNGRITHQVGWLAASASVAASVCMKRRLVLLLLVA